MTQAFWYVLQTAVIFGFYWMYISSDGWGTGSQDNVRGAVGLGVVAAMLLSGIIMRTVDWIRRMRLPPHLRPDPEPTPEGITRHLRRQRREP